MKYVMRFLNEVRLELAKVEWPKFDEFVGATIVALFLVACFALFFGAVDRLISFVAKHIFTYGL